MARMNEEAIREMVNAQELNAAEGHLREKGDAMRKESQLMFMESKSLISKNDEMKSAFAILLDKF